MAFARGIWLELYAANQLFGAILTRSLEEDVAARELALYSTLNAMGRATPTEVADVLGLALSTASAQLNRLVARDHATRVVNPADARSFVFELTEEGTRVTMAHREAFVAVTQRIRGRLRLPESEIRAGLVALEEALREEFRELATDAGQK